MDKLIDTLCGAILFVGCITFIGGLSIVLWSLLNTLGA